MAKAKLVPNATNQIKLGEFFPLMRDGAAPIEVTAAALFLLIPSRRGGRIHLVFEGPDDAELVLTGFNKKQLRLRPGGKSKGHIDLEPGYADGGACTIGIKGPVGSCKLSALFEEVGYAREANGKPLIPWNFWFYPFSASDPESNAWSDAGLRPLHKYAEATGSTEALEWETREHGDPSPAGKEREHWDGHCNFIAAASILFKAPPAEGKRWRGVEFTCEELKYFAGEFFGEFGQFYDETESEKFGTWKLPTSLHELKPNDDKKRFGPHLASLVEYLGVAMKARGHALMVDLRNRKGPVSKKVARERWNHAVYRYRILYYQWAGDETVVLSDPRLVEVEIELNANEDAPPNGLGCSGLPARVQSEDGDVRVVPDRSGRDVLLVGRLRFDGTGAIALDADDHQWNGVYPWPKKELGAFDWNIHLYPPRTALYPAKPLTQRRDDPGLMQGNPAIERDHILELLRLRSKYR